MSNGKSYTAVLLDVYAKIDTVEQRITGKLDATIRDNAEFMSRLATGDAKFKAIDDKLDGEGGINERLKQHDTDIRGVRNLNTIIAAVFSAIAALVGVNK